MLEPTGEDGPGEQPGRQYQDRPVMHQSSVHFPCRLHALALSHDRTARRSDIRRLMVAGSGMVPHHPGACGPTRRDPLL